VPKVIERAPDDRDILQKAVETAEFFLNSGGTDFMLLLHWADM